MSANDCITNTSTQKNHHESHSASSQCTTSYTVLCHPRCSTCKKALAWLDAHKINYTWRNIIDDNPTSDELTRWIEQSGLPLRRFFNTSGKAYRSAHIKDRLDEWNKQPDSGYADAIKLLSTDGMLCKRPILLDDHGNFIAVGFKENEWEEKLVK